MSTRRYVVLTTGLVAIAALAVLLWLVIGLMGGGPAGSLGIKTSASAGDSSEGIQVHGQWTIDVREANGALVSHHEFSNALTTGSGSGALLLAKLLSGDRVPGLWVVELGNLNASLSPCRIPGSSFVDRCTAGEPDLSVSVPTSGTNANSLVLNATIEADFDGDFEFVNTVLESCDSITAPADCLPSFGGPVTDSTTVTSKSLSGSDVVSVLAGQGVDVQVVLQFS